MASLSRDINEVGPYASHSKETARSTQAVLALELFAFLEARGVPYVVVGDVRGYDRIVASDIDIVVSQDALPGVPRLLADFAHVHGGRLVQAVRHEARAYGFVLVFGTSHRRTYLYPDVCADFYRSGRPYVRAPDLLQGRQRAAPGFWVPAPADAFAYYVSKRINKQSLDLRAFGYLRQLWDADQGGCRAWSMCRLSERLAESLCEALDRNDHEMVTELLPALRRALHRTTPVGTLDGWAEIGRAADRWLRPTGLWVAFYGPDGAGKTSVIEAIERRFAPAFRQFHRYHLRPSVGRRLAPGPAPVTDPHAESARNSLVSMVKLVYWWWDAFFGYWLRVRWQLVRSTLVVFDRYIDDLEVDPRRYRYGGPMWAVAALRRATPRPHLTVVLDAPADVLQARKTEVPPEESERQRSAYRHLAGRARGSIVVDAAAPLEDVVRDVEAAAFDYVEARTRRRLGLA